MENGDTEGERGRERERGKEEELHTEAHIICPRSKESHSDIICRMKKGWRCRYMSLPLKKTVAPSLQDLLIYISLTQCKDMTVLGCNMQCNVDKDVYKCIR